MTEVEWLACEDLEGALTFLASSRAKGRKRNLRKLRLFACACARRIGDLLDGDARSLIDLSQQCADRLLPSRVMTPASYRVLAPEPDHEPHWASYAVWSALATVNGDPLSAAEGASMNAQWAVAVHAVFGSGGKPDYRPDLAAERERLAQVGLLLCVFGHQFRQTAINLAWFTPTVARLATAAYEMTVLPFGELDSVRLAILADALEDAGCADAGLLGHLRSPGPHVRGCWALDLVLGKS